MQIHKKIEQARISANLSQDQMAEKLGIKRSTYQYWEKNTPSIDKIKEVARVLNLQDDYFFGSSDEKPRHSDAEYPSLPDTLATLVKMLKEEKAFNKALNEFKERIESNLVGLKAKVEEIDATIKENRQILEELKAEDKIRKHRDYKNNDKSAQQKGRQSKP